MHRPIDSKFFDLEEERQSSIWVSGKRLSLTHWNLIQLRSYIWISHLCHLFLQWSHLNVDSTDLKCSDHANRKPARVVLCNLINIISNITLFSLILQKHRRIGRIRNNRRKTKFCYKRTNITEGMKEMWFMAFTKLQKRIRLSWKFCLALHQDQILHDRMEATKMFKIMGVIWSWAIPVLSLSVKGAPALLVSMALIPATVTFICLLHRTTRFRRKYHNH